MIASDYLLAETAKVGLIGAHIKFTTLWTPHDQIQLCHVLTMRIIVMLPCSVFPVVFQLIVTQGNGIMHRVTSIAGAANIILSMTDCFGFEELVPIKVKNKLKFQP